MFINDLKIIYVPHIRLSLSHVVSGQRYGKFEVSCVRFESVPREVRRRQPYPPTTFTCPVTIERGFFRREDWGVELEKKIT